MKEIQQDAKDSLTLSQHKFNTSYLVDTGKHTLYLLKCFLYNKYCLQAYFLEVAISYC